MNVKLFTFYTMQEKTPSEGVAVLVKLDEHLRTYANMPRYYVCYYVPASRYNVAYFCPAGGEQCWKFDPAHVIAWANIA